MINFSFRYLRNLKNGGIFPNVEEEKGGELSTFLLFFVDIGFVAHLEYYMHFNIIMHI